MPPNILQLQREVESLSDERLLQEAQVPNMFPAYLTQQEMVRREQERNAYQARKAQQPTNTVHDRLIERAMSGIGSLPQQLSPEQEMFARQAMMEMSPEQMMQQQMMMQNPMPQPMADGGLVGYQDGGYYDPDDEYGQHFTDPNEQYLQAIDEGDIGGVSSPMSLRTAADIATALAFFAPPVVKGLGRLGPILGRRGFPRLLRQKTRKIRRPAAVSAGLGSLFVGRGRDPLTPDLPEDHPVFQYYGEYEDEDGGHTHSVPSVTQSDLDTALAMSGGEDEGISSLIASMQSPTVQRQELDLSQYFQMTPEEQAVLDRARADAQSLESRIDTEADRLSAQANILSNVSRAMARGQVPTISQPLRELQTEQRGRREGIMDESRAMQMAALAQEAGLSRAEQEALMERAIVGEERDYQEALRQLDIKRFEQYAKMTESDDPNVQRRGFLGLQSMGVTGMDRLTPNAAAQMNVRALSLIDEAVENIDTDNIKAAMDRLNSALGLVYGDQPIPQRVMNYVKESMLEQYPEEYRAYLSSTLPASGS